MEYLGILNMPRLFGNIRIPGVSLEYFEYLDPSQGWDPLQILFLKTRLFQAGCAPCLAGCRWYGICTKWVENLLFEVIL